MATMNTTLLSIPVKMQIVLGTSEMLLADMMDLERGSTLSLKEAVGDPVTIMVNGKPIGYGDVVLTDDEPPRFAVSVTSLLKGEAATRDRPDPAGA